MSDTTALQRRNIMIAVTVAAVVVAVAVALAVVLTGQSDDEGTVAQTEAQSETDGGGAGESGGDGESAGDGEFRTGQPLRLLPEAMGGQQAIDALGDQLELVAERNDTTVDELRSLLLRDASLRVSPSGRLFYEDTMTPPASQD